MLFLEAVYGYYLYLSTSPNYSSVTAKFYYDTLNRIGKFLNSPQIEDLRKIDMQDYFIYLKQRNFSRDSQSRYWSILKVFSKWLNTELGLSLPELPPQPKKPEIEIIPFSISDIKKLYASADNLRNKVIIVLLLDTGLRAGEFCRLKVSDVNLETGEISIKPFETGIKSRRRSVWISPNTARVLWRYLAERSPAPNDPLVSTKNNTPLERYGLRHILQRIGKRAGVNNVYTHRFRHTFAIQYLRNGGDVFTLKRILGHSRLTMTEKYLNIANTDTQIAHKTASPVQNLKLL